MKHFKANKAVETRACLHGPPKFETLISPY